MQRPSRKDIVITPHKGGRTNRVNVRATDGVKEMLDRIATYGEESTADVIERLVRDEWERIEKKID